MNDNSYTVEDLVTDPSFRRWVYGQLPSEDTYWENWLAKNPGQAEVVSQAIFVVQALQMDHASLPEPRKAQNVHRILEHVDDAPALPSRPVLFRTFGWATAACLVFLTGLSWYLIKPAQTSTSLYERAVLDQRMPTLEHINTSGQPLSIVLSDGSTVTLQPGSRLSYPESFTAHKREVILSGEGFFEIAKNPERPFFVYTNEIVTKVLGTSFSVRAYERDQNITVRVVSGKVSVLAANSPKGTRVPSQTEGLILTPNQMAVYARAQEKMTRSLVDNPLVVKPAPQTSQAFHFVNTPAARVFQTLEESYGVPIMYDTDLLKHCTVTAPLENESLYEKLDLICKVLRASYEVVDAQIIVSSKGCD